MLFANTHFFRTNRKKLLEMQNKTKMAGFLTTLRAGAFSKWATASSGQRSPSRVLRSYHRPVSPDPPSCKNNNSQAKATALFKLVGGTAKSLAFRCTFQLEALYLVILPVPTYLFAVSFFTARSFTAFSFIAVVRLVVCVLPTVARDVVSSLYF